MIGERGRGACRYECVGFHDRNRKQYVRKVCICYWSPNNTPSLVRTPQKAAHCLGFENSTVDEGGFRRFGGCFLRDGRPYWAQEPRKMIVLGITGLVCTVLIIT